MPFITGSPESRSNGGGGDITARRIDDHQPAVIPDDQIGIKYALARQGEHRTIRFVFTFGRQGLIIIHHGVHGLHMLSVFLRQRGDAQHPDLSA